MQPNLILNIQTELHIYYLVVSRLSTHTDLAFEGFECLCKIMNLGEILKLMIVVSLSKTSAQNEDPKLYKVIGEDSTISKGWSLLSSDHPLFSNPDFLRHIRSGDCENCRVIVKTEEIRGYKVKGNSTIWAGEDLSLSCAIGDEDASLLFPPVTAEIRTQKNTDGEFIDTANVGLPFIENENHDSFTVTSKCHIKSVSTGEPIDWPSHPLTTTVKCKNQTYIWLKPNLFDMSLRFLTSED